jgi:hypothetical protein
LVAKLDLSFVRELVRGCYADNMGRPAIDPVVFFKLHLIIFFEGIRSERWLIEMRGRQVSKLLPASAQREKPGDSNGNTSANPCLILGTWSDII